MSTGLKYFVTAILVLYIAILFLPFLMPLIDKDFGANVVEDVSLQDRLIGWATDPATTWVRLLILLPLGLVWFMVCRT